MNHYIMYIHVYIDTYFAYIQAPHIFVQKAIQKNRPLVKFRLFAPAKMWENSWDAIISILYIWLVV